MGRVRCLFGLLAIVGSACSRACVPNFTTSARYSACYFKSKADREFPCEWCFHCAGKSRKNPMRHKHTLG